MNRTPDRTTRSRPGAEPAELAALRGWLRAKKTAALAAAKAAGAPANYQYLADRAYEVSRKSVCLLGEKDDYVVSACTLRQALDGRLPTRRTARAFALGAGADEATADRLWAAADLAVNPPPRRPAPHVPGAFTTPAGLVRAMDRVRVTAPRTSLRALAEKAGPALSRSTLHRILAGRQIPTAGQLAAFAAACDAGEAATAALLAGHRRILDGPDPPFPHPCAEAEWAAERRHRDEAARPWLAEPERDWYDQQLHDEQEEDYQRRIDEAEALLDELAADSHPAPAGPSPADSGLHAELAAIEAPARPAYDTWIGCPPAPDPPGPDQP
ncbi:helix-turn-helix domain-containing protein [Streptomyces sp. NPDC090741]|uniref:helix-turn-helix domain-containing protein n=1 Tax=Streptomyces sp. NPDC090741 TaxID=3365967 RepID=UPI0037F9E81C